MQVIKEATQSLPQPQPEVEKEEQPWDDGLHLSVTKITATVNEKDSLTSSQFRYINPDGTSFEGPKHGGGGCKTYMLELKYPDEYLKKVTGYACPYKGAIGKLRICSLTFVTNKQKFGPIGKEGPIGPFEIHPKMTKEIGGFYGTADKDFLLKLDAH